MERESSIGTRAVACLLAVTILGGGLAGVAAGASSAEPALTGTAAASISDSLETDGTTGTLEDATDETTDTVAETTDNTTGAVENTTDGTTDTVEGTTDRTTDELENATTDGDGSDGAIDATVNETTETVDETASSGTDAVDGTVNETGDAVDETVSNATEAVDETEDLVDTTFNETGRNASLEAEAGVDGRSSSSDGNDGDNGVDSASESESAADNASTGGGNGDGADASEMPSPTETATDAVLVGMLGAITASGAAAGSAAAGGGASGAAGSAGAASAGWLSEFRNVESLRRAGTDLWKVLPLFRYSQYDDSDPLEHDRRRAIYETIEADPGCYLSRVSDRADIPLSTVRYHVRILEDEDLVTALKRNGKRRYFLEETDAELRAALAEPAKRDVLEVLSDLGAAHNGRLADELERDPSTVSHHLAALEEDGLVVRKKDGRSIVNQLPARVEAALRDEPAAEADSQPAPADD
ncbi:helix-turn-helix domain-containing protein [Natrinema versiforme]|uniref:Winged helix-turn-helix transcriptional regulator n=1 Tax=Natrinema versiforme TaxID=88724 RepID=A0A4P8WJV9_9EURY|nr:helix-turn-helix domain-containing protein [Natrinema versiforme]QCS42373.1 winged helix-turn-helix transcriptional regulator [Natrinema versiforme]